jgi:hypothetical protein
MPKVRRLIKNVYDHTKKKNSESRLYNILRQGYGFNYRYLSKEFKIEYNEVENFFLYAYESMSLKDFDKVCSLCPNHSPEELLEMIKMPRNNYGLQSMIDKMDNVKKIKGWYFDKRADDLEVMLKKILNSTTFEDKQDAIEEAKRKMNKLSFNV